MRAVLDACVLYPTILREVLVDCAAAGLYQPLWSERILGEWRRAAARLGPEQDAVAGVEIALLRDRFPQAEIVGGEGMADWLRMPDPGDRHVVETALAGEAEVIVTLNLRDFPRPSMVSAGLGAAHPDSFLTALWAGQPDPVEAAVRTAHARAEAIGGAPVDLRRMMSRARLPRLFKAIRRSEAG